MPLKTSLVGSVDVVTTRMVVGWVAGVNNGTLLSTLVDVHVDGKFIASISPSDFRQDVRDRVGGSGNFGFTIKGNFKFEVGSVIEVRSKVASGLIKRELTEDDFKNSSSTLLKNRANDLVVPSLPAGIQPDLRDLVFQVSRYDKSALIEARKIAVYVTYTNSGRFFNHQIRQVRVLREMGYFVVCVHATKNPNQAWLREKLGDLDIFKVNLGYDFGSWWAGIKWLCIIGRVNLSEIDVLLLMNDSCFGEFGSDLRKFIEESRADLCGVTNSLEQVNHVQSYLIKFSGPMLRSGDVFDILLQYEFPTSKIDVIKSGEINLSRRIVDCNGLISPMLNYKDLANEWIKNISNHINKELFIVRGKFGFNSGRVLDSIENRFFDVFDLIKSGTPLNPSHFFASEMISKGTGLLKREMFLFNPAGIPNYYGVCSDAVRAGIISVDEIKEFVDAEGLVSVLPAILDL
jgi:hypothetical protein